MASPSRDSARLPDPDLAWGWWPALAVVIAAGLWLVALGMGASRDSAPGAEALYWIGIVLIFVPAAVRAVSPQASRRERLGLVLAVALALNVVKLLHSPLMFTFYDELLHWRTVTDLLQSERLFGSNPLLPVSPDYPGLESLTAALAQILGWGAFPAALAVLAVAQVVFALALFLFFEQATARRAWPLWRPHLHGQPGFRLFRQPVRLRIPGPAPGHGGPVGRATAPAGRPRPGRPVAGRGGLGRRRRHRHSPTSPPTFCWPVDPVDPGGAAGRRWGLRGPSPAWLMAGTLAGVVAWLLLVARLTINYLGGNFSSTLTEILNLIAGESQMRQLFHGAAGDVAPLWERLAGYASVGLIMVALPAGLWAIWRHRRSHVLSLTLGVAALAYPAGQMLRFTPFGLQLAGRLPAFVFLPLAYVLAYGLYTYMLVAWPRPRGCWPA
jgi:hypothetical protein